LTVSSFVVADCVARTGRRGRANAGVVGLRRELPEERVEVDGALVRDELGGEQPRRRVAVLRLDDVQHLARGLRAAGPSVSLTSIPVSSGSALVTPPPATLVFVTLMSNVTSEPLTTEARSVDFTISIEGLTTLTFSPVSLQAFDVAGLLASSPFALGVARESSETSLVLSEPT